jgi:hypothetical protein
VQANPGLEPDALGVDQREDRDGDVEDALRHPGDAVEALLRVGVQEPELTQRRDTSQLVKGDRGQGHLGV